MAHGSWLMVRGSWLVAEWRDRWCRRRAGRSPDVAQDLLERPAAARDNAADLRHEVRRYRSAAPGAWYDSRGSADSRSDRTLMPNSRSRARSTIENESGAARSIRWRYATSTSAAGWRT